VFDVVHGAASSKPTPRSGKGGGIGGDLPPVLGPGKMREPGIRAPKASTIPGQIAPESCH
jgi:hypothetical protein